MSECSHVIVEEIDAGKRYIYCQNESTATVGGNHFCTVHGFITSYMESNYLPSAGSTP